MSISYKNNDRLLAEAMPDGIIILTEKGCLDWWNHHARILLGIERDKHFAMPFVDIISNQSFQQFYQKGELGLIEIESPLNPQIRLTLTLRPYWGGQQLIIIQDVTETTRLQAVRQDFIANVSHELRTPLTVFRGYLDLLQDQPKIKQEELQNTLSLMSIQTTRMEKLVQDLLLLARLENHELNKSVYQTVSVAKILCDICQDAKVLSGDKQHELHLELDDKLTLFGNPDELRSAFSNIIYNAVHYTPAKGCIKIFWYQDQEGKKMKVVDNGIGIPQKYIPRITQRFYRVDKGRAQRGGGSGIGLAIVKHVLLRHGGELQIKSEQGKGSEFCCKFLE